MPPSSGTALRRIGWGQVAAASLDIARTGDIDRTRTIYCGSFSKTLAPGLRVGWVCAAQPVIRKLVLMKQAADLHSASINQVVIHHVAEHGFEAQILKIRAAYRARRDLMLTALQLHMPAGVTWTRPEGGIVHLADPARRHGWCAIAAAGDCDRTGRVRAWACLPRGWQRRVIPCASAFRSPMRHPSRSESTDWPPHRRHRGDEAVKGEKRSTGAIG